MAHLYKEAVKPDFSKDSFFNSAAFSWAVKMPDCLLGVRNQYATGLCTEFAVTGAMYADMYIREGYAYLCKLAFEWKKKYKSDEWGIWLALKCVQKEGQSAHDPRLPSEHEDTKSGKKRKLKSKLRIQDVGHIGDLSVKNQRHQPVLKELVKRPLCATIPMPQSLKEWTSSEKNVEKVYKPSEEDLEEMKKYLDNPQEAPGDYYHAVLIVGYGEEGGEIYYLIQNSYGEGWGYKGFAKISASIVHDVYWPVGTYLGEEGDYRGREVKDFNEPESSGDSSQGNENQTEEGICFACKRKGSGAWVACDYCQKWFHCVCVNTSLIAAEKMDEFKCPMCTGADNPDN